VQIYIIFYNFEFERQKKYLYILKCNVEETNFSNTSRIHPQSYLTGDNVSDFKKILLPQELNNSKMGVVGASKVKGLVLHIDLLVIGKGNESHGTEPLFFGRPRRREHQNRRPHQIGRLHRA
jgi:hypothetical protein